jgi:hypothetical protein
VLCFSNMYQWCFATIYSRLHVLTLLQLSVLLFYCFLLWPTTTKQGLFLYIAKIYVHVQWPAARPVNSQSVVCYRFYLYTLDKYCIYPNTREPLWKIYTFMKNIYFLSVLQSNIFPFHKGSICLCHPCTSPQFFCAEMAHFGCCFSFVLHCTWTMTNFCFRVQLVVSFTSFMSAATHPFWYLWYCRISLFNMVTHDLYHGILLSCCYINKRGHIIYNTCKLVLQTAVDAMGLYYSDRSMGYLSTGFTYQ